MRQHQRINRWGARSGVALTLMLAAACTELKATSVTPTASASPAADTSTQIAGTVATDTPATGLAPVAPPASGVTVPTPGPLGSLSAFPQPSFTPALIIPLNGATAAAAASGTTTIASGAPVTVLNGATGTASTPPGSPIPSMSPFPALERISGFKIGGAAIDATNHLWLGDATNKKLESYDNGNGALLGTFALDDAPVALAFDSTGKLWVQLVDLVALEEFDAAGTKLGSFQLSAPGGGSQVGVPGLAPIPNNGGMWVSSAQGANTVTVVDPTGKGGTTVEAPGRVAAMTTDNAGDLFLAIDDVNIELAKFSTTGTNLGTFSDLAGLEKLSAIATGPDGTVWVSGLSTPTGQATQGTVVGIASTLGNRSVLLTGVDRSPLAIAFDTQGDLVLADGPAAGSFGHVGFMKLTTAGQVLAEKFYATPDGVLADRGDAFFWGINSSTEAVRFGF